MGTRGQLWYPARLFGASDVADRYLILSDLHLCDVEEHADGWKYFKSGRYLVDEHVAALVDRFLADAAAGDRSTLVLNGDVFDFDLVTALPEEPAPWPVSWIERRCGLAPTAEKSVWKLERVLAHHPVFVDTLARVINAGGRVVYVLGNHDRELHFKAPREALFRAVSDRLAAQGTRWDGEGLTIEPWAFHVPGVLWAEHGNQYDPFTAYTDLMDPTIEVGDEVRLALPMGNVSNRYLLSRIGRFNPFSGDYIRSLASYVLHWFRYYVFSKRSLLFNWLSGAVLVFLTLIRTRARLARQGRRPAATSEHSDLTALRALHCRPVYERTFRMIRELWLDRVVLWSALAAFSCALILSSTPPWLDAVVTLLGIPLLSIAYDRLVTADDLFDVRERMVERADEIATRLGVRLVTFGHDHVPKTATLSGGAQFVDSGTWAPITSDDDTRELLPGYRNYLVVTSDGERFETCFDVWPTTGATDPVRVGERVELGRPARSVA